MAPICLDVTSASVSCFRRRRWTVLGLSFQSHQLEHITNMLPQQPCVACGTAARTEYEHLCSPSWTTAGLECSANASDTDTCGILSRWSIILCVGGCAGCIQRVHHERVSFARAAAGSGRLRSVFVAEQHSSAWVCIRSLWTCVWRGELKVERTTTYPRERLGSTQKVLQLYDNDSAVCLSEHV